MNATSVRRRLVLPAVLTVALLGVAAPTAARAGAAPTLTVQVTITPIAATYQVGDHITTTFVVTNTGGATAPHVHVTGGAEEGMTRASDPPTDTFDLAPGASHSVAWAGTLDDGAGKLGFAFGGWSFGSNDGDTQVQGKYRVLVPGQTSSLHCKAYQNVTPTAGSDQPGEAGVTVTLTSVYGAPATYTATSGADGTVTFAVLPVGEYALTVAHWTQYYGDSNEQVMGGSDNECDIALLPGSHTTPTRKGPRSFTPAPVPTALPHHPAH